MKDIEFMRISSLVWPGRERCIFKWPEAHMALLHTSDVVNSLVIDGFLNAIQTNRDNYCHQKTSVKDVLTFISLFKQQYS